MDESQSSDIEIVLQEFKQSLRSKRDLETFEATTLDKLKGSIEKIQIKQHESRRLQNLNRLAPFLEATKQYGELAYMFRDGSQIMPFIWGPMKLLLEITSASSSCTKAFSELVDLYEKVGEALPLFRQYESFFRTRPYKLKILMLIYKEITTFHQITLECFQSPVWEKLFDINWGSIKAELVSISSKISRHRDAIQTQSNLSQATDFDEHHTEPVSQFDSFLEESYRSQRLAICHWLRPIDSGTDQARLSKIRSAHPGTGRWLLDNETFKWWFDLRYARVPPLLWLTGLPGAGKTILASLIVEEAQKLTPRPRVLFFYCKQSSPEHNTFLALARSFILQLLNQDKRLLLYLHRKHCDSNEAVLSSIPLVEEMLEFLLSSCESAYIIIDGLDECEKEERKLITRWFRRLVECLPETDSDRLRCLFVSQDDGVRAKDLQGLAKISIEPQDNLQDILAYSKVQAEELRRKFEVSDEESNSIATNVANSVKGIFLLARLIWINLLAQITLAEVEEQVHEIPLEIDKAYDRIMCRLIRQAPHQVKKGTLQLLGWLVCAKRPLKWHEIQTMKSINLSEQFVDFARHKFSVSGKDLCGSLVELRADGTLELIHVSAKLFLIRSGRYIDIVAKELDLACLCIDYLNLPAFECQPTTERILNGDYGFVEYAALNWTRHLEAGTLHMDGHEEIFRELSESLETFIRRHWNGPNTSVPISRGTKKMLKRFEGLDFYDQLEQSVASWKRQLRASNGIKPREAALDLGDIVLSVRKTLENIVTSSSDPSIQNTIEEKYGNMIFKCTQLTCQWFITGFWTEKERDEHLDKHIRLYRCADERCRGSMIGFASRSERDKHILHFHTEDTSDGREFPTDEEVERSMQNSAVIGDVSIALEEAATPRLKSEQVTDSESESNLGLGLEREVGHSRKLGKEREFECPYCQKVYYKRLNFTSHLKKHTDKQ